MSEVANFQREGEQAAVIDPPPGGSVRALPAPRWLLVALAFLVLLPRAALIGINENFYGDAAVRTELAQRWAQDPRWLLGFGDGAYQFGPLHLYLVGLGLWAWPEPLHVGRVLSLLFGTLTALPLFSLTRRLFGVWAAGWATFGFAAWGLHIQASTTAASEALSLFLVATTVALFARALDEGTFAPLLGSALVLNLACATRYDAWLLPPVLVAVLLLADKDRVAAVTRGVLFGMLCLPFPLIWMHGNELLHGDPLYPVRFVDRFHASWAADGVAAWGQLGFRLRNLGFWPAMALLSLSPGVGLLGLMGLWRAFRQKAEQRWLGWVLLVPWAYFTVRGVVPGNFMPAARFTVNQLLLLLPFAGWMLAWLHCRTGKGMRGGLLVGTVVLALAMPAAIGVYTLDWSSRHAGWWRSLSPSSINRPEVRAIATFLSAHAGEEVVLMDDHPEYHDIQIAFLADIPTERVVRLRWGDLERRVASSRPGLLVWIEGGELERLWIPRRRGRVELLGEVYGPVGDFGPDFRVYRRELPAAGF